MGLGWDDLEPLVIAMAESNPDVDPRALSDADLRSLAATLEGFEAARGEGTTSAIEAARAMWHWGV